MQQQDLKSYGCWELKGQLGSGGFGEVLHWRNRQTKQEIATKRLKANPTLSGDEIEKLHTRWHQEYEWTRQLDTPSIVRGVELTAPEDKSFISYLNDSHAFPKLPVIIMEYCNGGDVRKLLQQPENVNGLPECEVRAILRTLRDAIEFLHSKCKIYHRDLKPDNVVIVRAPNGRRSYKLTDFGFARRDPVKTLQQSVVGTQHYFAPEIVDKAMYKRNVDYWSLGVIAFELCCGVLPFIPQGTLYDIIITIRKKKYDCIYIAEDLSMPKRYEYKMEMPAEQHLSSIFCQQITKWLPMALDIDEKNRGMYLPGVRPIDAAAAEATTPLIFKELDTILETRILTVYCVTTFQKLCYAIDKSLTLLQLAERIAHDTGLEKEKLYFLTPTGHPHKKVDISTQPIDLYVEDFEEPVMLYIIGYQCDYKAPENPQVSSTIIHMMQINITDNIEAWQLRQFVLHTHFMLSNEQWHLATFLAGLKEYALTVEHEVLEYTIEIQDLYFKAQMFSAQLRQFETMLICGEQAVLQKIHNGASFYEGWKVKFGQIKNEFQALWNSIESINKRFESALRMIKSEANNSLYDEFTQNDRYALESFRKSLLSTTHRPPDARTQLDICKKAVYDCTEQRINFHKDSKIKKSYESTTTSRRLFRQVHDCDIIAKRKLEEFEKTLYDANIEYHLQLVTAASSQMNQPNVAMLQLNNSMHALRFDGNEQNNVAKLRLFNGSAIGQEQEQQQSIDSEFNTKNLITEALKTCELLSMDIDQPTSITNYENGPNT